MVDGLAWRWACAPACAILCAFLARGRGGWLWWAATLGWMGGVGALPLVWMMTRESLGVRPPQGLGSRSTSEPLSKAHRRLIQEACTASAFVAFFLVNWTLHLSTHAWDPIWPQSATDYERHVLPVGDFLQGLHMMLELFLPSILYLACFQKPRHHRGVLGRASLWLLGLWVLTQLLWWGLPLAVFWCFAQWL